MQDAGHRKPLNDKTSPLVMVFRYSGGGEVKVAEGQDDGWRYRLDRGDNQGFGAGTNQI